MPSQAQYHSSGLTWSLSCPIVSASPRLAHPHMNHMMPSSLLTCKDLAKLSPYALWVLTARTALWAALWHDIAASFITCAYWTVQVLWSTFPHSSIVYLILLLHLFTKYCFVFQPWFVKTLQSASPSIHSFCLSLNFTVLAQYHSYLTL